MRRSAGAITQSSYLAKGRLKSKRWADSIFFQAKHIISRLKGVTNSSEKLALERHMSPTFLQSPKKQKNHPLNKGSGTPPFLRNVICRRCTNTSQDTRHRAFVLALQFSI